MPRWGLGLVVVALAVAFLVRAFAGVDVRAAGHAIARIGTRAPWILVPFAMAMALDALAIRWLLLAFGRRAPFRRLLAIRIGTEALHLSAPAGFVVGDSASAALLDARCDVPLVEGATVVLARRWLVMRAHGPYIALGAVVGWGALTAVSLRAAGGRTLPWIVLASSLVPLALSLVLGAGFRPGGPVARVVEAASSARWAWLRARAQAWRAAAMSLHGCMARIGASHSMVWGATAAFFGCWILESCDTAIVLRLLGAPAGFAVAMAAEVGISLVKAIGNVAPAGLGVQDAGYAALLPAMGLTPETAAALVVVKRAKEVIWIAFGYLLLAIQRRAGAPAAAGGRPRVGRGGSRAASNGMPPLVKGEQAL